MFLACLFEVQKELLYSPQLSGYPFSFPSQCGKVLYANFSKVHISATTHKKAFLVGIKVPWRVGFRVHALGWGLRSKSRTPLKSDFLLSLMQTIYGDSWSDISRPYALTCVLVSVTYISLSSDFALKSFWMDEHQSFGIMSQCDPTLDLKINVGQCDLYFTVQWFFRIFWLFEGEHHTIG